MSEGATKVGTAPAVGAGPSIYAKPSLPYLLSEYGFEDKEANELRQKKEEQKKKERLLRKQAKKTESFDSSDADKDHEREKEREEHYEQMVKDLYRLRDYYYREYSGMLADKVERQRREQKERDAAIQKKRDKEKEEALKASHSVKKRLERHTLAATPVTENIPKTDLYHIVGLEEKLRKEGKIKTMSDYDKFREDMSHPRIFNAYIRNKGQIPDSKSCGSTSSQKDMSEVFSLAPDPEYEETQGGDRHPRSLSRISEGWEASRPGTRTENWAVTQQYPSLFKSRKSVANINKQKDLERRFPKLEMPKLHCFTMNLAKKPPDPEEVQQQLQLRAREKQRKQAVRAYTKMYQLAMSNAAVSARILDMHEDMDLIHGPDLCDVIADHHWMEAYGFREIIPEDEAYYEQQEEEEPEEYSNGQTPLRSPSQGFLPEIQQTRAGTISEEEATGEMSSMLAIQGQSVASGEEVDADGRVKTAKSKSAKSSAKSKKSAPSETSRSPMPLTMDEIHEACNIKEAKTLSTLWTNYMKAGKSIGT